MATPRTRWLLSILLVNLTNCLAAGGPPARPSPPECYIPCDEKSCDADIHCAWDPGSNPQIPTNYSLHWEPANSGEGYVTSWTNLSGFIINRENFINHGELRVWVEVKNQHGSAKSEEVVFNTAYIIKPPPPSITISKQQDSIELEWNSFCGELHLSTGTCDIRNRIEGDQVWHQHENGDHPSYTLDDPQPATVYEFQVRCACDTHLTSNWSKSHSIKSAEKAPVGELDIWRDCGISPTSFDCALTWKTLPISQARGVILEYQVRLVYNTGKMVPMNVPTPGSSGQLSQLMQYCRTFLKDVSSVSVSAFNALGATVPSHLAMPAPGEEKNEQAINLEMHEENLTVSWDPTKHSEEYVVQYKQVGCPPGQGFDWVKVPENKTTVFLKGQFKKHTPFKVSLFTVSSHSRKIHHLSSVFGYSLEGTPSRVLSFKAFSSGATQVTVVWEPVPLSKQRGVIQYYQIGFDGENVYNVSASPQHKNWTFELKHLRPGQEYEVWIRAVTRAGPGENTTTTFKITQHDIDEKLIPVLIVPILLVICIAVLLCYCQGENKACPLVPSVFYEKVPDPGNSHIFRQMKHQINDHFAWICIPIHEPHPKISMLEVVEIQPGANKSSLRKTSDPEGLTTPMVGDGCSQMDCQDDQREDAVTEEGGRTQHRPRREEYSKMVDSDEEKDKEEDREECWSSSEEEQFTSGYEKHFMPSALEVLEV
ncbi:interleukin 12 receptor, beta 2a, like [Lates calcarifer]|uniref:Interleukin 12 receptor, beta 2a, like n=1 Tax=Lates calcarifer TaxID=8187 RepID=A0A4W6DYH6_LATCA|nr:interleukin 12 receptor, beta 2a, like [Lates calcarifer]